MELVYNTVEESPGRFGMGASAATIVSAPFMRPADPIPATARPIISILDEVAAAHSIEPISKTPIKVRNEYFTT